MAILIAVVLPMGCGIGSISLAGLAKSIVDDPNTLQYWAPEKTRYLWDKESE